MTGFDDFYNHCGMSIPVAKKPEKLFHVNAYIPQTLIDRVKRLQDEPGKKKVKICEIVIWGMEQWASKTEHRRGQA